MMDKNLTGKVQTVLGLIDGEELGLTLPHEHLLLDLTVRFKLMEESVTARTMAEKPLTLDMGGWIRFHLFENRDNLLLNDEELAVKEITRFKLVGGKSVVDVTNWGIGQDPHAMTRIARATGLNIIMGTGYYTMDSGCAEVLARKTEDEIYQDIINDITTGTDGICAGIIGEIGADSWPLHDIEIKSLRAAVKAQRATGAGLTIHPGRLDDSPLQIVDVVKKAGADMSRVIIEHIDRTAYTFETMVEIAKAGCYLEFDCFSMEGYYPRRYGVFDVPNDAQRVNYIIRLIELGYLNQILIATDTAMKYRLTAYGGPGYAHIPENVIPWMRDKGIPEKVIRTITEENPKRILTFVTPSK
jgi:phosphotriesterase-related protein